MDEAVKVWDAASGLEQLAPKGHIRWVNSVAFSPDGQRLATVSTDRSLKLWDTASGEERLSRGLSLLGNWEVVSVHWSGVTSVQSGIEPRTRPG